MKNFIFFNKNLNRMNLKLEELFFKFVATQFSVDIKDVKENWRQFMSNEKKDNHSEAFHCKFCLTSVPVNFWS